jgi:hypothetical protein
MDQDLHGPQLSRVLPGRFPEPKPFLEALWTYYLYLKRKPQNLEIVFGEPHVPKNQKKKPKNLKTKKPKNQKKKIIVIA